ncbi:hypothetical protein [Microbacterium sp. RU33B]|uniref:hypothetical protein n=1 Tax=Microbacterium sp. RU33B TaxID=1907390 RepID=UPI000978940C|nr:hypothetical protein [Microbacterium sp. RU33B]
MAWFRRTPLQPTSRSRLRATTDAGESYEDPSEDVLFEIVHDVEVGNSEWVIVERVADASRQTYIQTIRNRDGSYAVEYREGDPKDHFVAQAESFRDAHALLAGWAFDTPGWAEGREWSRLTFMV